MKGAFLYTVVAVCVLACAMPFAAPAATNGLTLWGEYATASYLNAPTNVIVDVSSISAGHAHGLAVKDGRVYAWGDNDDYQLDVPVAASSLVTKVAANIGIPNSSNATVIGFSVALRNNGEVVVWGDRYNLLHVRTGMPVAVQSGGVSDIAAGGKHILALKDGAVYVWGSNDYGVINVPASLASGVSSISAGGYFGMALKSGQVVMWGDPNDSWYSNVVTNIPSDIAAGGVSAIAAGTYHALALKNGRVYAWGEPSVAIAVPVAAQSGVTAIAAGDSVSLALKSDGSVMAWGERWISNNMPPTASGGVTEITAGGTFAMVRSSRLSPYFPVESGSATDATAGLFYSNVVLQAVGIPDPVYMEQGNWPAWLSVDPITGALYGMPEKQGTDIQDKYTLTLLASNQWGTAEATILFHVSQEQFAPVWVTTLGDLTNAHVGVAYQVKLEATGYPSPTFGLMAYSLPNGLSFSNAVANGVTNTFIRGVPTAANTTLPLILYTSNAMGVVQLSGVWNIVQPVAPSLQTTSLSRGTQGREYTETQLSATGSGTLTFSVTGLPNGMTLSADGLLSGTPAESGEFTLTVVVSGVTLASTGETLASTNQLVLRVAATYPPALPADWVPPQGTVTSNYSATITVTAGTSPVTYSATGLPPGLSMTTNGVISGVPTTAGTYTVQITATNFRGSDVRNYTLIIIEPGGLPDSIRIESMMIPTNLSMVVLGWQNPTNNYYQVVVYGSTNLFQLAPDAMVTNGVTYFGPQTSPWTNYNLLTNRLYYYQLRAVPK